MPKVRNFMVLPALPDSLKGLETIAGNMFWSWNPEFVELFKRIDSNLWTACGHNPVKLLGTYHRNLSIAPEPLYRVSILSKPVRSLISELGS